LVQICARLRPGELVDPAAAAKYALRRIARRGQFLSEEIRDLDAQLRALVTAAAPHLLVVPGVGIEVAGQLLVTAGDNPDRLRTDASFARLCGVPPLKPRQDEPDATGSTAAATAVANNAVYTIALCRMRRGSSHTRLRHPTHRPKPVHTRNHPLPQALHHPRDLPPAHIRSHHSRMTSIRSIALTNP